MITIASQMHSELLGIMHFFYDSFGRMLCRVGCHWAQRSHRPGQG